MLVFQNAAAAEAFRILESLEPEWEVLEEDNREAAALLLTYAAGVKVRRAKIAKRADAWARGTSTHSYTSLRGHAHGSIDF